MELSTILWSLLIGAILLALGALLLQVVQTARATPNTTPTQAQLLDALKPLAQKGIMAGFALAEDGLAELRVTIDGWDRASIANAAYDLIPDSITVAGKTIPITLVKTIVTRAAFIDFVKQEYDTFHAWELQNEAFLAGQVAKLKEADITKTPDVGTKIAEIRAVLPPGENG